MSVLNGALLCFLPFIIQSVAWPSLSKPEYFTLFLHGSEVHGSILKLIQGHPVAVTCIYRNDTTAAVSWKTGLRTIANSSTLSTPSLERGHATQYSCHAQGYHSTIITMLVMYPPKIVEISGPFTVSRGSDVNLTCFAESYPDSNYTWTEDPAYFAPHISTEATVSVTTSGVAGNEMWLYCIARNTMIPTNGVPVVSPPVTAKHHIIIQAEASAPDDQNSNGGLVAAVALGWVVAVVTVAIAVFLYFRNRGVLGSLEHYKQFQEPAPAMKFTNAPRPPPRSNIELITSQPDKADKISVHSYLDVRGSENFSQDGHVTAEPEDMYDQIDVHAQTVTGQQRRVQQTQHTDRINVSSTGYLVPKRRKSV